MNLRRACHNSSYHTSYQKIWLPGWRRQKLQHDALLQSQPHLGMYPRGTSKLCQSYGDHSSLVCMFDIFHLTFTFNPKCHVTFSKNKNKCHLTSTFSFKMPPPCYIPNSTVTSRLSTHPFKYASWLSTHFLAKKIGFKIY